MHTNAPAAALKKPGAQNSHAVASDAPLPLPRACIPAGHAMQDVASSEAYVAGAQGVQACAPLSAATLPGVQALHADSKLCPGTGFARPGGH